MSQPNERAGRFAYDTFSQDPLAQDSGGATRSPLPKRWVYRDYDPDVAKRLESEVHLPRLMAVLLAQRKITDPEQAARFLSPELSQLDDPFRMLGMRTAVDRLRRAITNRERILIYGDYDVDGTISVVLLKTLINLAGGQADFHVPHRVREGYGMRREVIERAAADGVQLVITADNGIREADVIERASELGLDAIITDHHLPSAGVPNAAAVINPNQPGCDYPDKNLCGAGVVLKLTQALLTDLDWPRGQARPRAGIDAQDGGHRHRRRSGAADGREPRLHEARP